MYPNPIHFFYRGFFLGFAALLCLSVTAGIKAEEGTGAAFSMGRVQQLVDEGKAKEAQAMLVGAMQDPEQHSAAYGKLVNLAIAARDQDQLNKLFNAHRAYPFEVPELFQVRVDFYELRALRKVYNQAVQDFLGRQWPQAEQGFTQLLGDTAFHSQAVPWLFRIAMKQKDFDRARFIATLAKSNTEDAAASPNILGACAAQRKSDREKSQEAMTLLSEEIKQRNGYVESLQDRLAAQQTVFVAMIRLHNEIDQCFRFAMKSPAEARPLFPDLPDKVLAYLAR